MSWNDYYRFRFSNLKHKSFESELPGLRGWISGWGTLFVIVVVPLSGTKNGWSDLTPAVALAVPLAGFLWLIAAIGESLPRSACYLILAICVAVIGTAIWVTPGILSASWNYKADLALSALFGIYSLLVAYEAHRQLRARSPESAV